MNRTSLALLLALCAPMGPALAQAVVVPAPAIGPDDLAIGPDDEVVVREYVVRRRPALAAPVVIENTVIRPGSVIPVDVGLAPFDDAPVPALRRYSYFVSVDNKVVVVNPANRVVVRILDR